MPETASSVAEELLGKKNAELHLLSPEETHQLLKETNDQFRTRTFHAQLRAQRKDTDDALTKYTVQQMHFTDGKGGEAAEAAPKPNESWNRPPTGAKGKDTQTPSGAAGENATTKRYSEEPEVLNVQDDSPPESSTPISPLKKPKTKEISPRKK